MQTQPINTLRGRNAKLLNAKSGVYTIFCRPLPHDDELVHAILHFELLQLRSFVCRICVADCIGIRLLATALCESHKSYSTEEKSLTIFSSIEECQQLAHTNLRTVCRPTAIYKGRPAATILL